MIHNAVGFHAGQIIDLLGAGKLQTFNIPSKDNKSTRSELKATFKGYYIQTCGWLQNRRDVWSFLVERDIKELPPPFLSSQRVSRSKGYREPRGYLDTWNSWNT